MTHRHPTRSTIHQLLIAACFVGAATTIGCDTKSEAEEAADEAEDYRELRQNMEADAPDSAREMRDQADIKSMDKNPPKSEEELRKEMDLHPKRTPEGATDAAHE